MCLRTCAQLQARELLSAGDHVSAVAVIDALALETTEAATKRWTQLWQELMVRSRMLVLKYCIIIIIAAGERVFSLCHGIARLWCGRYASPTG